jgi:class 3 adenylate cyclase
LLGSDERVEYTLVGDTVNLAQRLQDLARPAGTTVLSGSTAAAVRGWPVEALPPCRVKGRTAPVVAFRLRPGAARDDDADLDRVAAVDAGAEGGPR